MDKVLSNGEESCDMVKEPIVHKDVEQLSETESDIIGMDADELAWAADMADMTVEEYLKDMSAD